MEQLDLNSEAEDPKGAPKPSDAHDASVDEKTLFRPVASRDQTLKPPSVLSFLTKPPAVPPHSQVEVHKATPAVLQIVRPSEATEMEHRVNEAEARLPKWMRSKERPARPAFDLEAVPTEELQPTGDVQQRGFGPYSKAAALEPQGLSKGPQEEGRESERSPSLPGKRQTALERQSSVQSEGREDARGDLASTLEQRMERQRMLARERRQKIESRKERISQERAQEMDNRRAKQGAKLTETPGRELGTASLGEQRPTLDPSADLSAAKFSESPVANPLSIPLREARKEPAILTTLRELQAVFDASQRASQAEAKPDPLLQQGGASGERSTPPQAKEDLKRGEEERLAAQETKVLLERLLDLQKKGMDSKHVPLSEDQPQRPVDRRPPASELFGGFRQSSLSLKGFVSKQEEASRLEMNRTWRASLMGQGPGRSAGFKVPEESPKPADRTLLSTFGESLQSRERATARGVSVRSVLDKARQFGQQDESLDLSLHLGPPSPSQPKVPLATPSQAVAPRPFPQDVEAVIREHLRRAQASGQAKTAEEGRGPTDGGSSTSAAPQLSPSISRPLNLAEILSRSPEGKRKREDSQMRSDSGERHGRGRWLSAAAAEIEESVLEELEQQRRGKQQAPPKFEKRK